ncbi:MAG TPA: hypothetical protein VIF39_08690, partial [Hyphomicrobium sp.]
QTVTGGTSPYIQLTAGNKRGSFLLDYGTTQSSLSRDVVQSGAEGGDIAIDNLPLPSFPSGRFKVAKYWIADQPPGGQIGIIGTDFLSLLTADFSFRSGHGDVVLSAEPCDPDVLRKRGMIAARQRGFFTSDLRKLGPATPNVPVLFLDIGGVSVPAQIDTGYDDRNIPPSIDINETLYEKLVSAGIPLTLEGEGTVATCGGVTTNEVYAAPQTRISLKTDGGREIRQISGASLIRKIVNGCGGIADMQKPTAQLGASIISGLGSVVFDARSELVWVASGG